MQSLTDANGRQHPDSRIWWVALWEERLDRVDGEGERHDGDGCRPHLEMMMIVMMVVVVVMVMMVMMVVVVVMVLMVMMDDGLTTMHSTQRRMKAKNLPNVIMMYA